MSLRLLLALPARTKHKSQLVRVHIQIRDRLMRVRIRDRGVKQLTPAAIDKAPASRPDTPVSNTTCGSMPDAATPSTSAKFDTRPSFAPNTAARNVPASVSRDLAAKERMTSA